MNSFIRNIPIKFLIFAVAVFSFSCSEDGNSSAMKETLLQTEVELLSKRLESLDRELASQIGQVEKNQRSLIKSSSVSFRDLSESNLTVKIERFLISPDDFSNLLENEKVSDLRDGIQDLVSEKKATTKPILIAVLSAVSEEEKHPTFAISDRHSLNVPIGFEPISENKSSTPNPKLAPKEWMKEGLGTSFTANLLAREGDRFLLGLEFVDITRLENERYPFPKIFAEKEPGHLEMPVVHEGEIKTNITATIGNPEFIGTTIVPEFSGKGADQFQAVFVTILSAEK